jgi:hypothetical protein
MHVQGSAHTYYTYSMYGHHAYAMCFQPSKAPEKYSLIIGKPYLGLRLTPLRGVRLGQVHFM